MTGSCHIIGDSIAAGLAAVMSCTGGGHVGATSAYVLKHLQQRPADEIVIVSVGSNDRLEDWRTVWNIRARLGERVLWILPQRNWGGIAGVAHAKKDKTIQFAAGADGIHPRSYRTLAHDVQAAIHDW